MHLRGNEHACTLDVRRKPTIQARHWSTSFCVFLSILLPMKGLAPNSGMDWKLEMGTLPSPAPPESLRNLRCNRSTSDAVRRPSGRDAFAPILCSHFSSFNAVNASCVFASSNGLQFTCEAVDLNGLTSKPNAHFYSQVHTAMYLPALHGIPRADGAGPATFGTAPTPL